MRSIATKPLTPEAFAPYGDVLATPAQPGRAYFEKGLATTRPGAWASVSLSRAEAAAPLPLRAQVMERHAFSSQTFIPLNDARWLVVVAPDHPDGGPDISRAEAFEPAPGQGITYRAGTWHHPMTVFTDGAPFAVFMWRDGTAGDEEFVDIEPITITSEPGEGA